MNKADLVNVIAQKAGMTKVMQRKLLKHLWRHLQKHYVMENASHWLDSEHSIQASILKEKVVTHNQVKK